MEGIGLLAATAVVVVVLGLIEALRHRRNLARIPIRIHVNGTRGKSGVTRLIAAGLRAGGIRTCAKTTGTLARMIMPDGSEYPVYRPARANVIEQVRIVDTAAAEQAEALVIECMALQPALQSLCELKLVRATHGVITNARADHLDVMGPTADDVAEALAGTVPRNARFYTAERTRLDAFREAVDDRGSALVAITPDDVADVTAEELNGFPYIEHAENVALALRVCADLGIDRDTALRGMHQATPDPGVMTTHTLDLFNGRVVFVNGFAANDPESTEMIWNLAIERFPEMEKRIAIFNCRHDRADRSVQLAEACVHWQPADHYLLIGTGTEIFASAATEAGLDPARVSCVEDLEPEQIVEAIIDLAGRSAMVMGLGNIGGPGLPIVHYFDALVTANYTGGGVEIERVNDFSAIIKTSLKEAV